MTLSIDLTLNLDCPTPGYCFCCDQPAIPAHEGHLAVCWPCSEYLEAVARTAAERYRLKRLRYDFDSRSLASGRGRRLNRREGKTGTVVTLRPLAEPEKGGGA